MPEGMRGRREAQDRLLRQPGKTWEVGRQRASRAGAESFRKPALSSRVLQSVRMYHYPIHLWTVSASGALLASMSPNLVKSFSDSRLADDD